ncbi:hypothetical protein VP01_7457g1 [Puccinia sorghi]|uniref:Uncharacterized protein n=1 Tax=Puccinia sorghi TaxID=27349 RepID=A0A0L6UDB2_9BASI|nr:hypothetical protein VP01_7457g1 [Puccinia sorghi]
MMKDVQAIQHDPQNLIGKAKLDVQLTKKICCQLCFHLYYLEPTNLWHCHYKPFNDSDACDKELFIQKKIYQGHTDVGELAYHSKPPKILPNVITTPCCVFLSQPILTWITWLLSMPHTENKLQDWIQVNQKVKDKGYLSDIQHGHTFKNTTWKSSPDILKLGLSLFIDWFNPRGNKIAGKVESSGLLALSCLNLPPIIRTKLSHMCIARITPGPYSANPQTFNHLLSPLVDKMIVLDAVERKTVSVGD